MTVNDWLTEATNQLQEAGTGTARLDALVLLEDATGQDRSWLLAHPETTLQGPTLQKLGKLVQRRTAHEPLAYIRGKTEFYGRDFIVNKDVLEPRPESETMITLLLHLCEQTARNKQSARKTDYVVVDVGTGSGALAITTKLELPELYVFAIDIDPKCLKVARQNAKKHKVDIGFFKGNLTKPLPNLDYPTFALLCNLPYVPDGYTINQAAAMEPRLAIFGGADGLDIYRQLFNQLNRGKLRVQFVLTESLPTQHQELAKIAHNASYELQKSDDFIQVFKNRLNIKQGLESS